MRAQAYGKTSVKPNSTKMVAETYDQNVGDTVMNAVDPLSISVKIKTETERAAMITNGRLLFWASAIAPPRVTGSKGKMHGANTVSTPAMNEVTSKAIGTIMAEM